MNVLEINKNELLNRVIEDCNQYSSSSFIAKKLYQDDFFFKFEEMIEMILQKEIIFAKNKLLEIDQKETTSFSENINQQVYQNLTIFKNNLKMVISSLIENIFISKFELQNSQQCSKIKNTNSVISEFTFFKKDTKNYLISDKSESKASSQMNIFNKKKSLKKSNFN